MHDDREDAGKHLCLCEEGSKEGWFGMNLRQLFTDWLYELLVLATLVLGVLFALAINGVIP